MVHFYIGDGKGKTTAALGLALRAAGFGRKVYIAQFLKSKDAVSGEIEAVKKFNLPIKIERFSCQIHPLFCPHNKFDKRKLSASVKEALLKVESYIENKEFDVLVLDEILNAAGAGFCSTALLKRILKKAQSQEVILTGREAPPDLAGLADYVSCIKKMKHPFDKKVAARKGVEF